ncbi:MAG: AzlD domain-containing protein [Hyphomicrobiales bacterium]|nr:AzlD domain-containing protein [Hyphomicrobiales bacterium]
MLAAALAVGTAATYVWRLVGVLLAGSLSPRSRLFDWVGCVAYGLLAALIARMVLLPEGPLAATGTGLRLACAGVALATFFAARRNVAAGVAAGSGLLAVWLLWGP